MADAQLLAMVGFEVIAFVRDRNNAPMACVTGTLKWLNDRHLVVRGAHENDYLTIPYFPDTDLVDGPAILTPSDEVHLQYFGNNYRVKLIDRKTEVPE
jgi:hypothetical protein